MDFVVFIGYFLILAKSLATLMCIRFSIKFAIKLKENNKEANILTNPPLSLFIYFCLHIFANFSTLVNSISVYFFELVGKGVFAILMGVLQLIGTSFLFAFAISTYGRNLEKNKQKRYFSIHFFFSFLSALLSIGYQIIFVNLGANVGNPFSFLLVTLIFATNVFLIIRTIMIYLRRKKLISNEKNPEKQAILFVLGKKLRTFIVALFLSIIAVIFIVVDYYSVSANPNNDYNTFYSIIAWILTLFSLRYFSLSV